VRGSPSAQQVPDEREFKLVKTYGFFLAGCNESESMKFEFGSSSVFFSRAGLESVRAGEGPDVARAARQLRQ
jgi:hypothetical protein